MASNSKTSLDLVRSIQQGTKEKQSTQSAAPQKKAGVDALLSRTQAPATPIVPHYKAWTDAFGNVNISDTHTGQTERYDSQFTWGSRQPGEIQKDSFGQDLGQSVTGALMRQGANYRSAAATLGLGVMGLLKGDKNYQPEVGSTLWKWQEGAEAANTAADLVSQDSKEGRNAVGRLAMDVASGAVDLAGDQLLNLALPGSGMAAMATRVFGSSSEEARQQGKDISQQVLTGVKAAAIEWATEKVAGIGGRKGVKPGWIDGALDKALDRFVARGGNAIVGKMIQAFGSEAAEEILSSVLNPLADKMLGLDPDAKIDWGEAAYEGLIGGLLGLAGGASEGVQYTREQQQRIIQQSVADAIDEKIASQQAAGEQMPSGDIQTPPVTQNAPAGNSDALNSGAPQVEASEPADAAEAARRERIKARVAAAENIGANTVVSQQNGSTSAPQDATINAQPTTADSKAVTPQEGVNYGRANNPGEAAGRQNNVSGLRPGEAGNARVDSEASDGGVPGGVRGVREESGSRLVQEADGSRVNKAKSAIAKHDAARYDKFKRAASMRRINKDDVQRLYAQLKSQGLSESELNERIFDQSVASAIRAAVVDGRDRGHLMAALLDAGFDAKTAEAIQAEILEGETEDLPFTVEEREPERKQKRESKATTKGELSKATDESGNEVAVVKKRGDTYDEHVGKDTKTVRFENEKYKKQRGDKVVQRNWKTGGYIVQRGVGDNYLVVNKNGDIEGAAYDDLRKAKARLMGHSDVYQAAEIPLADNRFIRYEKGRLILDTDRAFTDLGKAITRTRSQASDDLNVAYGSYAGAELTTDYFTLDFSNEDSDGNKRSKQEVFNAQKRLQEIIDYGITGQNGKHYVFAGQTANQSKNNVIIMMEESAYDKLRSKMVGGLNPDEIAAMNPAKYLANQGTYFTPSNADTGVKLRDAIVMSDVYTTLHNITRRFLRTSDANDMEALMKAGLSKEEAEARMKQFKVGATFLLTGDIILKSTDGTGFINSESGKSFQFRSLGGFKGLLQSFDFVNYLETVIPFGAEDYYTDDNGKVSGGVRFTDREKGVELLDKWGEWQPIKGKKALLFDSVVKFAGQYKNSDDFYEKAGTGDIRSVPKENVYGANDEAGMVEGYTKKGMAQMLRSQTAFTQEDLEKVLAENVTDPIGKIMSDPKMQAKLFGVDLDSPTAPASSDVKAMLVYYFGEPFLRTRQGQKWVQQKLADIVSDAKGGRLYFEKDKAAYQWVAPDPFGVIGAMTAMRYQTAERGDLVRIGGRYLNGYEGLKRGQVHTGSLAPGLTLLGRNPSMEENDVQLRTNVRNAAYDELVEKYGLSDDITYFALNDELSLNLDNDYDGDAVLAVQGAIAEAIRNTRKKAGIDPETGAKKGALFTEFVHGKADPDFIHDNEVIYNAVRAGLVGENIGKFDNAIDFLMAMPTRYLTKAAKNRGMTVEEFRSMLLADFAAAYKFNVDYAKTGYYPSEFKAVVDNYIEELNQIAADNGFFIGTEKSRFRPVPPAWQYSKNASKRSQYEKAVAKKKELEDRGSKKKTILGGSGNVLTQLMYNQTMQSKKGFDGFYEFYKNYFDNDSAAPLDMTDLSSVDPLAYSNVDENLVAAVAEVYADIMRADGDGSKGNEHREELVRKIKDALTLDDDQFASFMAYVLSIDPKRANYATLLNVEREVFSRNARVLGNIKGINKAIADTKSAIEKQKAKIAEEKARIAKAAEARAVTANELLLQADAEAVIDELSALTEQIGAKVEAAEKTRGNYERKAANAKTLEAYMKAADGFARYAEKSKALKDKLRIVQQELSEAVAVKEESKEFVKSLLATADATITEQSSIVKQLSDRLHDLNDTYERWLDSFEREETKRQFYGIGLDTETGLEGTTLDDFADALEAISAEAKSLHKPKQNPAQKKRVEPEHNEPVAQHPPAKVQQEPQKSPVKAIPKQAKAPEAPNTHAQPDAKPVERVVTYGDRYSNIESAANRIRSATERAAEKAIPEAHKDFLGEHFGEARKELNEFGNDFERAFSAEDNGASMRAFAETIRRRIAKSQTMQFAFGDAEIGNVAKAATAVVEAEGEAEFQNAVSDFSEIVAKEIESLPRTIATLRHWSALMAKKGRLAKLFSSDSTFGRAASVFFGYQRDVVNILQGLDNYAKYGDGYGYQIAKDIINNTHAANMILGNAIDSVLSAQKAFEDSGGADKTVELSFVKNKEQVRHNITLSEAIDLLHTLETVRQSKISPYSGVNYNINGWGMRLTSKEQYDAVMESLMNAITENDEARAYYDALSEGYALYKDASKKAVRDASGRTVDMYDRNYYPLLFGGKGAKAGEHGYDFGLDETRFTKRRIQIEGGSLLITDPAQRFNAYAHSGAKLISRAAVGAELERLNRGGIAPSLTELVASRYGKGHTNVVEQFIKDASNFRSEEEEISSLLRTLRLNVQGGVLVGNFGSMLKQFPSVFNAVGVIDFDSVLHGVSRQFASKESRERAASVGSIKTRHQGNLDPSVSEALDSNTRFTRALKKLKLLKIAKEGFEIVDSAAIRSIYLACEYQVEQKDNISKDSPEFEKAVMDYFVPAFMQTQPQFDKILRPYVQTSPNEFVRMFGMFKTQPLRNLNTMIRTMSELGSVKEEFGTDSKEYKETAKQARAVVAGQATASLMFGALGALAKLLYHRNKDLEDDEGNLDGGKVMARVLMNAAEATGGMLVFGDAAVKLLIDAVPGVETKEFYGLDAGSISSLMDAIDAINSFIQKPTLYNAKKTASYIATLFGIPLNNAYAIVNSAIMYTKDITGDNEGNYDDILKAIDAEIKAEKKAEEKAAKEASTASGYLKKPFDALVDSGVDAKESKALLKDVDADNNNSIKQAELWAWFEANPDKESMAILMWNAYGWKTSWSDYKAKQSKKK